MSMIIKDSKLFSTLDKYISNYTIIAEADQLPFPESPEEDPSAQTDNIDPTETPAPETIPDNEEGAFISDTKLAMFANTLLKAYQTKPKGPVPNELLNVTSQNANEVIKYISDNLELDQPTNDITDDLSNI